MNQHLSVFSNSAMEIYDRIGHGYAAARRPDPRFAAEIWAALGDARSVVNVGAGSGNYEPPDRRVVAVEPSPTMIAQRPPGAARVVRAVAEALPFADRTFDAALALWTLHHWTDLGRGLHELGRVSQRQVIVLNEPHIGQRSWLAEYWPAAAALASELRAPGAEDVARHLAVRSVSPLAVPRDCVDGFTGAYWGRPEAYLDPAVRAGMSTLAQLAPEVAAAGAEHLRRDLESGAWDARWGELRTLPAYDIGYRLIVAGGLLH